MAKVTTKPKATNTKREPRTVKLTTIIWTIAVLAALLTGFAAGISASNAYAESVNSQAKTLVKELRTESK